MPRLRTAVVVLGALQLLACHPRDAKYPLESAPEDVRSGTVLTLKQNISLPAGSPDVYFQDQRLVAPTALRPSYPYCRFGLDDPASALREVQPSAFVVSNVEYDERSAGSAGKVVSATRMNLKTELGAKGYHMTCMLPASAGYARFITVPEIRGAVGEFFTVNPAK